jgi:hypothetical protein
MKYFNRLYRLGSAVDTGDDHRKELYTLAAIGANEGGMMLSVRNFEGRLELLFPSSPFALCSVSKTVPGGTRGKGTTYRSKDVDITGGKLILSVTPGEVYYVSFFNK